MQFYAVLSPFRVERNSYSLRDGFLEGCQLNRDTKYSEHFLTTIDYRS